MRMCFVSQEYPPETEHGGLGSQTYLKAHGLASLGHETYVVSRSPDYETHEYEDGPVRMLRIPGFYGRLPLYTECVQWITYSAEVAAAVCELHSRAPFDIIDFPEWGGEGYVHLLNQTEWNHIPTVTHLHGPLVMFAHMMGWPEIDSEFYWVGTQMESTCLRLTDAVFSSGSSSTDWCSRYYGVDGTQIPTLHTGVDTGLFFPRDIPKDVRPTILFVGKLVPNKGVKYLVDAACRLAREYPDLRLRMLGGGEAGFIRELNAQARSSGFPDLLDLPGFVSRKELPLHYSRAHVFAAPSFFEGGPGFVYLEAMACGLPVVACSGTGVADVVTHEESGLLVPPKDVDALTDALRWLLDHPDERQAMAARARRYVLEQADSQVCLKRLEAFYTAVASGRPYKTEDPC
jgi:glycogen synthase